MRASLCPAAGHTPHPIVNKSLEPMPGSSSAAPPPIRDAALDDIAQLAAELTGLEAAALWLASGAGAPPRWGAFGVPIQASQLPALAPLAQPGAAAAAPLLDQRPVRQSVATPLRDASGAAVGRLIALGFEADAARADAPQRLERLARALGAGALPAQQAATTAPPADAPHAAGPLQARLHGTLRALQMGSWVYAAEPRHLALSSDAAQILGTDEPPAQLDALLQRFAPDAARSLRHAFVVCLRDGRPIDVEVPLDGAEATRRWLRFIGEAAIDACGGATREIHGAVQDVTTRKQAQEETVRLAMRLTTTLASITEAFVALDRAGQFMYVNRASEQLLGSDTGTLLGQPIHRWLAGQSEGLLRQELEDALAHNRRAVFEDFYPALGKWLELRAHPYAEGLAVYLHDVTARRHTQEQLMLLQTGIARLNDVVLIVEVLDQQPAGALIAFVNDAFERLTGFTRGEVIGRDLALLEHGVGTALLDELARGLVHPIGAPLRRREMLLRHRDGASHWIDLDVVPVRGKHERVTHWVAVGRDVTQRKQADAKIHHLAFYDALTDLPNRQLLIERLQSALTVSEQSRQEGALMFIDLDNFKVLNDTLGHSRGDLLLRRIAERLTGCVRRTDTVARIGGDEFVVLLQDLGRERRGAVDKALTVASKVLARMREPFDLDGYQHYSTVSIGVAQFSAAHEGVSELLKQADMAMYQAKNLGRNTVAFFDPALQAALSASAALGADLRAALQAGDQFLLYYQPQFDRARRVVGVEALLRWKHPVRGLIGPNEFIPIAEDTGLILPLDHWVMQQACQRLAAWAGRLDTRELGIAVNVSARWFRHPEFVDQVMAAIVAQGVSPRLLKLELTESLLADRAEITLAKMDTLKRAGVTLALDDFGTGYSSLAYLKRLPLDQLKIDKGFVDDVLTDPSDAAISSAIIDLAHSLKLSVIAEGVETEAQYRFLADRGCELFQGFLLARPAPLDEVERFIERQAADANRPDAAASG